MLARNNTTFEMGEWIPQTTVAPAQCAAAVRCVLRWAGSREDDARTVLTALGLLPDAEHKPTVWRANIR